MFSIEATMAARASATCRSRETDGRVGWRSAAIWDGEAAAVEALEGAAEGGGAAAAAATTSWSAAGREDEGVGALALALAVACGAARPSDESVEDTVVSSVCSGSEPLDPLLPASVAEVLGVDSAEAGVALAADEVDGRRLLVHEVRNDMVIIFYFSLGW
jgi:hypothetical protein